MMTDRGDGFTLVSVNSFSSKFEFEHACMCSEYKRERGGVDPGGLEVDSNEPIAQP